LPPEPTFLAFDTSAAHCAAALLCAGKVHVRIDMMARGQAEHLMPMLEEVLAAHNLSWSDLAAIGVGTGPGNFTGIRISVAAARGLALGLGIPAVGVSNFEAAAYGVPRPVDVLIPAPRDQAYSQRLTGNGGETPMLLAPHDPRPDPAIPLQPAERMIAHIARIAAERFETVSARPAPLYVRAADAAPSRDAPPVILP
jgi:tRNA threonylcarbamoyladenosine biosynthesis protein TsaB